jgi:tetratricopeptide (TPR) repeat protein
MPIRRPRGPKPTLRHVSFLEAAAALPESSPTRATAQAGFLTLRFLDEWVSLGGLIADPATQAHTATKQSVDALAHDTEARTAMGRIIEAITMLHDPDAQPVLPRVFAFGSMLEHRGQLAQAADVYATVARYVDGRAHFDLAFDALMKQGFCCRLTGDVEQAQRCYESAGMLAGRARDRSRVLQARIGEAKVTWSRGDLPAADAALAKIAAEAEAMGDTRLHAIALHDCASVARLREDLPRAIRLTFESFKRTEDEREKERVLADLGNFLGLSGAFATARAALSVLEVGGSTQEIRWRARENLMDLATREGSETVFEQHRRSLESQPLPAPIAADYFRDVAKGLARFGRGSEAREALARARALAAQHGLHQVDFALDEIERNLNSTAPQARRAVPVWTAPEDIATAIEALARGAAIAV